MFHTTSPAQALSRGKFSVSQIRSSDATSPRQGVASPIKKGLRPTHTGVSSARRVLDSSSHKKIITVAVLALCQVSLASKKTYDFDYFEFKCGQCGRKANGGELTPLWL